MNHIPPIQEILQQQPFKRLPWALSEKLMEDSYPISVRASIRMLGMGNRTVT